MTIYDINPQSAPAAGGTHEAQRPESTGAKVSVAGPRPDGQAPDQVQLSTVGAHMGGEAVSQDRDALVAHLTALYQAGSYQVDAQALSGRILDDSIHAR